MKEGYAFVDHARVTVEAGDGGNGCISFRREKFVPRGGPNGGDGGRGGSIIFEADRRLTTLLDQRYKPHYRARRGSDGQGVNKTGASAEDLLVFVPLGTVFHDEEGEFLADLTEHGQRFVAARGGDGGLGNQHFATSTNKAPRKATEGHPGEARVLELELKVIADAGLVGLPNAGKSTLLRALTNAEPKVADYPFTTLTPNLGVYEFEDCHRITIADIPGLIEGAHQGAGLGSRFLRHIERTKLLIFLIADFEQELDPKGLRYQFDLVRGELESYSADLEEKPFFVCVSKVDEWTAPLGEEMAAQHRERVRAAFDGCGAKDLFFISSVSRRGLDDLMAAAREHFDEIDREIREALAAAEAQADADDGWTSYKDAEAPDDEEDFETEVEIESALEGDPELGAEPETLERE